MNPFEELSRMKKVMSLVEHIDRELVASCVGLSERAAHHMNEAFPAALRQASEAWWLEMSKRAGVRVPSASTRAQVFAIYDARARRTA